MDLKRRAALCIGEVGGWEDGSADERRADEWCEGRRRDEGAADGRRVGGATELKAESRAILLVGRSEKGGTDAGDKAGGAERWYTLPRDTWGTTAARMAEEVSRVDRDRACQARFGN